jgi:formylglycine-generating enzyme
VLARIALLSLAILGNSKGPATPAPPLDAKKDATAKSGAAMLTAPLDQMIMLAGGSFMVGSSGTEVGEAIALCHSEVLGPTACVDDKKHVFPVVYPFAYEYYVHKVFLDSFSIDRTEVTVAAYRRCVATGDCSTPTFAAGDPKFDRDDYPVTHVSYEDARKYCAFRKARLPTEAEWERAARGSKERRFPWGNLPNAHLANHGVLDLGSIFLQGEPFLGIADPSDGYAGLAPVGSFPSGATPEGILDLAGNVSEWVADYWSEQFVNAPAANPKGPPSGTLRVVRGGSYRHPLAMIRGASRDRRPASAREPYIGFRCARDVSAT